MDNNDSNSKSPQTGGLKLMTVFIAVLALHVVVIGGFTVYHLMSGGSTDADIVSLDKSHKDIKGGDTSTASNGTTTDANATQPDKSTAPAATPAPDVATTTPTPSPAATPAMTLAPLTTPAPAATPAPVPAQETPTVTEVVTPTPGPAPLLTPVPTPLVTNPAPLTLTPAPSMADNAALNSLTPPADLNHVPANASAPLAAGPVHMPPASVAPSPTHLAGQGTYTVKITDSFKKIAKAHHVTVAQLKEANHIKSDTLHTGQKLVIPAASKTLVAKADSAPAEAKPSTSVLSATPAVHAALYTSTTTESGTLHNHTYTIAKGDTLSKIAHKFKTTTAAIIAENNISNPTKLTIGKKLKIPSRESRSAAARVPVSEPFQPQPSEVKTDNVRPSVETIQSTPSVPSESTQAQGDLATFTP